MPSLREGRVGEERFNERSGVACQDGSIDGRKKEWDSFIGNSLSKT